MISLLGGNGFNFSFDVGGGKAVVTFKKFIPNATKKVVDDANGVPMISMMLSGYGESVGVVLKRENRMKHQNMFSTLILKKVFMENRKFSLPLRMDPFL